MGTSDLPLDGQNVPLPLFPGPGRHVQIVGSSAPYSALPLTSRGPAVVHIQQCRLPVHFSGCELQTEVSGRSTDST